MDESSEDGRLDPSEVSRLYISHHDDLFNFLFALLRQRESALEVLQRVFVKVLEKGHTSRPESRKGWLYQTAYHEAMAYRRSENRQKPMLESHLIGVDGLDVQWETVERVRRGMESLPLEQREVVALRIYDQLTFQEIADREGIPLGTVLSRMQAALKKLRNQISEE